MSFNSFNFDFSGLNFANFGNLNLNNLNNIASGFDPGVGVIQPPPSNNLDVITRFVRANEVQFSGTSLCPDKIPNFWFDSTNVNAFCQKSNRLELSSASVGGTTSDRFASIFADGEGIVHNSTNAFAKVITTSNNIVYLNQNFVTLNLSPYGANTFSASNFAVDDVVVQTTDGLPSGTILFQGKVAYFDSANAVLAVEPQTGTLNVASGISSVLIKRNGTNLANAASIIRGNIFSSGSIRGSVNVGNTGVISSFDHSSGCFSSANGSNTLTILTQANTSIAVGNTLYITSGTGFGEQRLVIAVTSNNELVLNAAINSLTSNSKYTFGPHVVDEFGSIAGIFHIPESPNFNFPTGTRVFTITDNQVTSVANNDYLMRATANYEVGGRPPDIVPPPVVIRPPVPQPRTRRRDPLAQTFFTPEVNNADAAGTPKSNYGIYVSSVDLFFAEKPILADLQLPVSVQIVEVSNGLPTEKVLATSTVECKDVKVSTIPDAANNDTITNFRFADPLYLNADTEYALVVISDSPDYNVFICELGGFILGTNPPRRVSQQPYLGSLFKSQNASTWTPIQNQDLMFRLRKCVFPTTTGTVLFKPTNQLANVNIDSLVVHTLELNHKPTNTRYKIRSNNVSNVQDADFTYIPTNSMYKFGFDLNTSTKSSNRRRTIFVGDSASMNLGVELSTSDADVSPIVNLERVSLIALENFINDGSISNTDISITSGGNHSNAANITVTISAPDMADGVQATAHVETLSSGAVSTIIMDEPGSGYVTTPTITFSEPSASSNATGLISGETNAIGGNCKNRYLTKMITLADGFDAGDLRVYIDGNRPRGTNIHAYYKVMSASDTDSFNNKKWKLMTKVSDTYSSDQKQLIELEYRPSLDNNVLSYTEDNVVYPLGGKFKYFAIKIVLTAADPTVVPAVKNFRAIATPSG